MMAHEITRTLDALQNRYERLTNLMINGGADRAVIQPELDRIKTEAQQLKGGLR